MAVASQNFGSKMKLQFVQALAGQYIIIVPIVVHTGADLLHEAFIKIHKSDQVRNQFDDQFEHIKVFGRGLSCDG